MKYLFRKLYKYYGNHTNVSEQLGITARHYREIRSGRIKPGTTLEKLIKELSYKIDQNT